MRREVRSFNLLMDEQVAERLVKLAENARRSRGAVVRDLIRAAWATSETEVKFCADGERCPWPRRNEPGGGGVG